MSQHVRNIDSKDHGTIFWCIKSLNITNELQFITNNLSHVSDQRELEIQEVTHLLIALGINHAKLSYGEIDKAVEHLTEYVIYLNEVLPSLKILLAEVPPSVDMRISLRCAYMGQRYKELADRWSVMYVPFPLCMIGVQGCLSPVYSNGTDSLHLTRAGSEVWARALEQALYNNN